MASSCAVAAVSSVEAETCSADAEDSSATDAISLVAVLMVPTRSVMSMTAWPIDSNASRVLSTVATPLWVRSALCDDGFGCPGGLGLDLADQRGDVLGGGLRAFRELPDLLGDDREAAALLACPCGLDGGVQRQEVGLGGDGRDGLDDAVDLLAAVGEALHDLREIGRGVGERPHRCGCLAGGLDALMGDLAGLGGGLCRLVGRRPGLLDHACLALGSGGDVADGVCDLLDGATGLVRRGRHLLGRGGQAVRRGRHLGEDGRDVLGHAVEGDAQRVVLGAQLDAVREVAVCDLLGGGDHLPQVALHLGEGHAERVVRGLRRDLRRDVAVADHLRRRCDVAQRVQHLGERLPDLILVGRHVDLRRQVAVGDLGHHVGELDSLLPHRVVGLDRRLGLLEHHVERAGDLRDLVGAARPRRAS